MTAHKDTFTHDSLPDKATWPEFIFGDELSAYPAILNAADALLQGAIDGGFAARSAVISSHERWSYLELNMKANQIAQVLVEDYGLVPGMRVLLRGNNSPMLVAIWYAIIKAGGVVVATMTMLRQKELDAIIEIADINFVVIEDNLPIDVKDTCCGSAGDPIIYGDTQCALEQAMASKSGDYSSVKTASDDVALLAFTSGTTGKPKATMHFHRDILAMADTFAREILKPKETDVFLGSPPIAFTFGLGGLLVFPARFGAAVAFFEGAGPAVLLDTIERHKVTTLFTAPTAYKALLKQLAGRDISSLKTCVSAGENLPLNISDDFYQATGIRLIDGIGATEMIHIFISAAGDDIRPGSTGKVVPGYKAEIWGDDDEPVAAGVDGRLAVQGPTGCRYLKGDRQEKYVINGWNVTGDIFRQDEDGYFWFVARADDIIISSGYNIAAPEVEQGLLGHDAVQECAVVGVSDEERGAIVKAFVVLKQGVNPSDALVKELQDFVKATIAPYKYPRCIEFIESLPKSATGKLLRSKLKED